MSFQSLMLGWLVLNQTLEVYQERRLSPSLPLGQMSDTQIHTHACRVTMMSPFVSHSSLVSVLAPAYEVTPGTYPSLSCSTQANYMAVKTYVKQKEGHIHVTSGPISIKCTSTEDIDLMLTVFLKVQL